MEADENFRVAAVAQTGVVAEGNPASMKLQAMGVSLCPGYTVRKIRGARCRLRTCVCPCGLQLMGASTDNMLSPAVYHANSIYHKGKDGTLLST